LEITALPRWYGEIYPKDNISVAEAEGDGVFNKRNSRSTVDVSDVRLMRGAPGTRALA
jgi:hypothetical protein